MRWPPREGSIALDRLTASDNHRGHRHGETFEQEASMDIDHALGERDWELADEAMDDRGPQNGRVTAAPTHGQGRCAIWGSPGTEPAKGESRVRRSAG